VLAAQHQVDLDLAAADEALADAEALCTWDEGSTPDAASIQACQDALDAVLVAQRAVDVSQDALAAAASALDELLDERAATSTPPTTTPSEPESPSSPTSPTSPSSPSGPSGPSGSAVGGAASPGGGSVEGAGATASSPSSADLIAYQAEVDATAAAVTVAEQAISQATIVSPVAGTVVAVGIAVGDEVSAAAPDQAITVAGDGGYEVTATVSVTDLPDLEVGQPATVRPDGTDDELDGEVVGISISANEGTTGYTMTIALTHPLDEQLRNGSIAEVSVTTAGAAEVLAVPTSAVTVDGDQATVTVFDGSETEEVAVEIGAIGATWTEIRGGLDAGQQVVLADLDAPLPGSATDSSGAGDTQDGGDLPFTGGSFGGPPGG
jgi:multidrug efflux pump subunit AcrA (membrane-fusion protein)